MVGAISGFGTPALAQQMGPPASTTPDIHYDFPFQMMWDDAVLRSARTGKPVLAFDLDLIDSGSIRIAQEVIDNKSLQVFIRSRFEPAMNDFAIDPPMSVGLDSLRNLGWRLSGLEKNYQIAVRPCIIILAPDKEEMDRIVFPQNFTPAALEKRIREILAGKNTLKSTIAAFWKDTTSIPRRQFLINMFEERSKYDSVVKHLEVLRRDGAHPKVAHDAWIRYAVLRLQIEGAVRPMNELAQSLGHHGEDSVLKYSLLQKILEHYKGRKLADSVAATYERIMSFTGQRDPDMLNEYAWHLATYSKDVQPAVALIEEAISKRPSDPNFYDTRAKIESRLRKYDEAMRDESHALSLAESDEDRQYFKSELAQYKELLAKAQAKTEAKSPTNSDQK